MEGAIVLLIICVIVVIICGSYIAKNGAKSGIDVVCPTCNITTNVPCEGEYTCNVCNNDFSYGRHSKIGVICHHCKKSIFVPGDGKYICPKCNIPFTYGEQKSDTIHTEPIENTSYNKYYDVLGCDYNASGDEINKKYKEMVAKFHPDKIISKDLPEELIQFSTNKFIEIQEAYEKIKPKKTNLSEIIENKVEKVNIEGKCPTCKFEVSFGQVINMIFTCPHCGDTYNVNNIIKPDKNDNNCYEVLGCNYDATDKDIDEKYKKMSLLFQKDDIGDKLVKEAIEEAYKKIKSQRNNSSQTVDLKTEYLKKWGLINEVAKINYSIVLYYRGNPLIDAKGNYFNKPFYLWADNNIIYLLDVDFNNSIGLFKIDIKDVNSYNLTRGEVKVTFISLNYNNTIYTVGVDCTVYGILLKYYPTKDLDYINQKKIV